MNEKILISKITPLSSRITKSQSVSSIFQKINTERNQRNKMIIKYSSIDNESRLNRNKNNSDRKSISSSSYNNIKIIDDKKFHNNIYQDIDLNLAPSFIDNISEIRKIINGKKYNNLRNMYGLYLNSPFPKEYLRDIKYINKRKILIMSKNNRNLNLLSFKGNNSCEDLFDEKIKLKSIITDKSVTARMSPNNSKNNIDTNKNSKNTNKNNSKLSPNIKNNYSTLSTSTNRSLITLKFPEKQQSESNVKINQESIPTSQNNIILQKLPILNSHNSVKTTISDSENNEIVTPQRQESFLTGLAIDKMKFNINNLIIDKTKKKREKIDKYEEKILKLKIYQTYQKEKLEKLLNNEELFIQEKIDHIIKMYKLYEKIYEDYMDNMNKYKRFLFKAFNDIDLELRTISSEKKYINYQLEVLINKLIEKQIVFEYLISTRNFLFLVKNNGKKVINMDKHYIHKVSNRRQLVTKLFDLFGRTEDSFAYKYLKKIIPLDILDRIISKKVSKKSFGLRGLNTINRQSIILDEGLSPPPPGEIIFEYPEDFINILNSMTNNDLELIANYQKLEEDKKELKAELKENIAFNEKLEKSELNNNIKKNEKFLEEQKEKYNKLTKKCEYFNDLFTKKKELSSLQLDFKIFSYKSFNNIYLYNKIQYNKLRIKYKIEGLVLLEKLINNVNVILSMNKKFHVFDLNEIYQHVPQSVLSQILVLKIDYFNKDNQSLINDYTLKLLKLYEYFGEILTNRNEQLKNLDYNKYMRVREKVLNERKIYNAQIAKKMIEEKRENTFKKLKQKWDKMVIKDSKKSDIYKKPNHNKSIDHKDLNENLKSIKEEQEKINFLNFEDN